MPDYRYYVENYLGEDIPEGDFPRLIRRAQAELARILEALDGETYGVILRAKGIVPCADGGWIHFDYTPGEQNIRKGAADVTGRLCVIGSKLREEGLRELFGL